MNRINTDLLDLVGNTPVVNMKDRDRDRDSREHRGVDLFAKLEYYNPTGSIKDRPAAYIIRHLQLRGTLARNSTVIESSSGNFGIALAAICRALDMKFICVVDPALLPHNAFLLEQYGAEIVRVTERDDTGGYLKSRIKTVHSILERDPKTIWINQYANHMNAQAHYFGTGMEIYKTFSDFGLDVVFVPVGSGGTIAGVSTLLKEQFPSITVVAVDTVGSVIFGGEPKRRYIPGMGSSIRPELIGSAKVDLVLRVEERDAIQGCMELVNRYGLFVGGSSGAVYFAAKQFFDSEKYRETHLAERSANGTSRETRKALLIFPDKGERYNSTIYNPEWVSTVFGPEQEILLKAGSVNH